MSQHPGRSANLWLGISAACCCAAAAALRWVPPGRYAFYPQCPFAAATGWLCPGCGSTRAMAALMAGHMGEAWRMNALVVCLLPLVLLYCLEAYRRACRGDVAPWPRVPNTITAGLALLACGFCVWRNLA